MKVMCDTNIILDVLLDQEPFAEASAKVLSLFEAGTLDGYTTASCITDIFYIVRKHLHSSDDAYDAVNKILKILKVCDVHEADVREALRQRAYDFEDCLVAVCAKAIGCEVIVTRDKKGFFEPGGKNLYARGTSKKNVVA